MPQTLSSYSVSLEFVLSLHFDENKVFVLTVHMPQLAFQLDRGAQHFAGGRTNCLYAIHFSMLWRLDSLPSR